MKRGVLILSPFFAPNMGGVETHLTDLCDYLCRNGDNVWVFTFQPLTSSVRAPAFERDGNLEINRASWFGHDLFHRLQFSFVLEFLYLAPALFVFSLPRFYRVRNRIDVIHSHGVIAAFVGILLARIFHKKCVVSIHAIYNLSERPALARVMRNLLGASDEVLVLAKKSRLELVQAGLDPRKIRVFTYWVNQANFRPEAKSQCKDSVGLSDKFVVLFVGRLLVIKGVRMVLEIARRLTSESKVVVAIVGDGPCRTEVESAARMLPNLKYVGSVPNENLNAYYNAADVLLVPSLYEEGYGRVIVEASSCGTPVIASNRGGIPEAVDSSVGVLVEPTVDNFMSAIGKLYRDRTDLAKMASNCRSYAEANFSEANAQIILDAYG